jgi:hypothetical protein
MDLGFETLPQMRYIAQRIGDWDKFSIQVNKFGKARPILNSWYQNCRKVEASFFPSALLLDLR